MSRSISILALVCLALSAAAARAQVPPGCKAMSPGGDYLELTCPLVPEATPESWRFRANFTGVHDDTTALLAVRLDDQPVTCAPGSTTALLGEGDEDSAGEDGALECKIVLNGAAGAERRLWVQLRWRHAQHVSHALVRD